ncbi:unnamed protein product [Boreogadus saida]
MSGCRQPGTAEPHPLTRLLEDVRETANGLRFQRARGALRVNQEEGEVCSRLSSEHTETAVAAHNRPAQHLNTSPILTIKPLRGKNKAVFCSPTPPQR